MSENLIRGSEADWVAEIESVLVQSRRSNAQVGITGALLMTERSFVQVLEGPAPALAATLDRIRRDPRHRILRVEEGALPARRFGEWSMAYLPRPEADAAVLAPTRDFARGAVAEPVLLMMHYLLTEGTD